MKIEELIKDIHDRAAAMELAVSEDKLKELIRDVMNGLDPNDPVVRKIQFGGTTEEPLIGTKYARFGLSVADIEFAYDVLDSAKRSGISKVGPSETLQQTFEKVSEAVYLSEEEVRAIDKRALDDMFPRIPKSWFQGMDRIEAMRGNFDRTLAYQNAIRAMDTAESGYGQQLLGATYVRDLWEGARPESRVFGLLDSFEMMDATVYIPVEVDIPEMIYVGENTVNNSPEYPTVKTGSNRVQVDAKKFIIHQMWSGELEEDSIIAFVAYLRRQAQLAVAHYTDSLVLNGDVTNAATGNINLDDADPADTKHYLAFDGIRHAALVDNPTNALDAAGPVTLELLGKLRGLMVDQTRLFDFGHPTDPNDLVYLADPATADAIAMMDQILTLRMQNPDRGALLNGEVARLVGYPIVATQAMSLTEADGKVSSVSANNTKGQVVLMNRRGYKVGWRRRIKIETERLPARDQNRIIYSMRLGLGRWTPTANMNAQEHTAVLYNIDLT